MNKIRLEITNQIKKYARRRLEEEFPALQFKLMVRHRGGKRKFLLESNSDEEHKMISDRLFEIIPEMVTEEFKDQVQATLRKKGML